MSPSGLEMRRRRTSTPAAEEFNSAEEGATEEPMEAPRTQETPAEQLALVPVENSMQVRTGRSTQERREEMLPIEDLPAGPVGQPEVLGPRSLEPLFNQEDVRRMEELERQAPILQSRREPSPQPEQSVVPWSATASMVVEPVNAIQASRRQPPMSAGGRLEGTTMRIEDGRGNPGIGSEQNQQPAVPYPVSMQPPPMGFQGYPTPPPQWHQEQMRFQWQCASEIRQATSMMKQLQEENMFLRMQLMEEREGKYKTPPDQQNQGNQVPSSRPEGRSHRRESGLGERRAQPKEAARARGAQTPQEDGPSSREEGQQAEDGATSREVVQQVQVEDGSTSREVGQQAEIEDGPSSREGGRQGSGEDGATSREVVQQEESRPRGLEEDGSEDRQGRRRSRLLSEQSQQQEPTIDREEGWEPDRRQDRRRTDPTVDAMLKLMQGMQQLQQQIVNNQDLGRKGRGDEGHEGEHLRSNIELHKLPEWSVDSAPVDFADWLLLVHSQLSDLSESSGEWWEKTLEEAKRWYRDHLQMRPLEKLRHQVRLSEELKQQRWARISKRASNLLLQACRNFSVKRSSLGRTCRRLR